MAAPKRRRISFLAMMLALVLVAIAVGLAYRGWSFYRLAMEDRPGHPDFRTLRSTGSLGLGYGWVAAMLVVLNLSYLIRRRFGGSRFGSMAAWLDVHVFTGLLASVLVSFHSAFEIRNPVAMLAAVSLGLVVLTGLLGRFLYALAPAGARERLRAALAALEASVPGTSTSLADAIGALPGPNVPQNASLTRSLFAVPAWLAASRARRRAVMRLVPRRDLTRPQRRLAAEVAAAAAADARASGVAALLRTWRGLHRLFALRMLAAVLLHAGVAWYYGYRWIFS